MSGYESDEDALGCIDLIALETCFKEFMTDVKMSKEGKDDLFETYARELWRLMCRCRRKGKDPRDFGFDRRICAMTDPCNLMTTERVLPCYKWARQIFYSTIASLHPYFAVLNAA